MTHFTVIFTLLWYSPYCNGQELNLKYLQGMSVVKIFTVVILICLANQNAWFCAYQIFVNYANHTIFKNYYNHILLNAHIIFIVYLDGEGEGEEFYH